MNRPVRPILGVIAAEANSIEQRQIIKGIARFDQCVGIDTIIISNNYNPNVKEKELFCENRIYDLILSDELDGLIVISESFVNEELRKMIADHLSKKNIPIVVVGTYLPEMDLPHCTFINTSDENDIEDLTDHLVEKHGFTEIDIITGYDFIEASNLRVSGYRKSLEKHGIEFDEKRVHFGNFWMNSGEELAERALALLEAVGHELDVLHGGVEVGVERVVSRKQVAERAFRRSYQSAKAREIEQAREEMRRVLTNK